MSATTEFQAETLSHGERARIAAVLAVTPVCGHPRLW
jgi:hypothetical protein